MGIGDELMAAGEARRLHELHGRKVRMMKKPGRPRWNGLWQFCPDITRSTRHPVTELCNGPGRRPYIDYGKTAPTRWAWRDYEPMPARIRLPAPAMRSGKVLIEPNIKASAPPAKQWGRWQELVDATPWCQFVQIGPQGTPRLRGVEFLPTPTVVHALRAVAGARAAVLPEGGLHHACAAFGIPAVVLYGAYITPHQTGYDGQVALWVDDPAATGWRVKNSAARAAWDWITPALVAAELENLLHETAQGRVVAGRRAALNRDDAAEGEALRGAAGRPAHVSAA